MSIGRDAGYNLAAAIAPALFTLIVVPFYLDAIGAPRFGVLAICWTMISASGFASLGMGPALTYRLATMRDVPPRSRSALVWTALMIAAGASLVGALLIVGISELYFRYFFASPSGLDTEIRRALPLLAALLPISITIGVLNGALQGMRRFGALSAISIFNSALIAVTPLTVAYLFSVKLSALVLATVLANFAVLLVEFAVCGRIVPLGRPARPKRSHVKDLFGFGAWMSGTALIAPMVLMLDRFVIGALRGPRAVAAYVLPYNLVQQLVLLPASLTTAVMPRLAALPDAEVQQLQSSSLTWLNSVLTPLSILAIAVVGPFLYLWIGPSLATIASPVAAILVLGAWVHGIGHIPSTIVVARNRPDLLTKLLLAYLAPYVAILYFATLHFGVIGAAAAWTIRAAFDPVLFAFTRPYPSDLRRVALSAAFVLAAMAAALTLSWTSVTYWALMVAILAAACFQNRTVLISSAGTLRRMPLPFAAMGGGVAIGDGM